MNDRSLVEESFKHASTSPVEQQQQGYLLARQGVRLDLEEDTSATHVADEALRERLQVIHIMMIIHSSALTIVMSGFLQDRGAAFECFDPCMSKESSHLQRLTFF